MITNELKKSILQLASEGNLFNKLIGNTSEELEFILLDQKDNKKYNYIPVCDYPFSIPSNWSWVKLEDICLKITDGTHSTPKYTNSGIPFISVKNVSSGIISFENTKFISKEEHKTLYSRCNPEKGDLVITKVGTTGIPAIVEDDKEFSLFVSVALLKININKIYNKYLYYILQSPVVQKQVKENTRGVGNKNWVLDAIKTTIIPLPPFDIQKAIVEKIEYLFKKIDEINPIVQELDELNRNFSYKIKNSVLKSLIEKGISNIKPEKMTFEDCIISYSTKSNQIKQNEIYNSGMYPVVSQSQSTIEGYSNCKEKIFHHESPVLVYGDHSNTIKYIDFDFIVGADGTKVFGCNSNFNLKYLYYNIMYNMINIPNSGYSRHYKYLKKLPIYYYPIEEQQRIVNIIEQLLPLCSDIELISNM